MAIIMAICVLCYLVTIFNCKLIEQHLNDNNMYKFVFLVFGKHFIMSLVAAQYQGPSALVWTAFVIIQNVLQFRLAYVRVLD